MIRKNQVAGQFYPENPKELQEEINKFLNKADFPIQKGVKPLALIAPHAGYVFSGQQAAKAYKSLKNMDYNTVCVISPSHYDYFPSLSIYPGDGYETPLGIIPIDGDVRDEMIEQGLCIATEQGHHKEHALEVQLPFLQTVISSEFKLIPLIMGAQDSGTILNLIHCIQFLYKKFDKNILFVASSDLSHFHNEADAEVLDMKCINHIKNFDGISLWKDIEKKEIEACGAGPMAAVLQAFSMEDNIKIKSLGYSHSGQVIPDRNSVVGYTSAVIYK